MIGYIAAERLADTQVSFIANVREEINGTYSLIKRVKVGLTQETFSVGEAQFVKDEAKVVSREKWNRWGTLHPVMEYDIRDAKPMDKIVGKEVDQKLDKGKLPNGVSKEHIGAKPYFVKWVRSPKPSSASVNLLFRRGGLKAMMAATKNVAMDPRLVGIMCFVGGAAASYLLLSLTAHPASCIPDAGFYCKLTPIPQNVTVAH